MEICGLRHALALLRDFFSSFTSYSFFALQDFRICQVGIFVDASVQSCLPKAELCLLPIIEFIGTNNPKKRAQQNLFLSFFASGFGLWYPMLTVKEATEYGYYARYEHSPGRTGRYSHGGNHVRCRNRFRRGAQNGQDPLCDFNARPEGDLPPAGRQSGAYDGRNERDV
jgi:hypothetical protein